MDDRKLRILKAVVDEYIRTGEPVGSKAVCAMMNYAVSSATIRNDMAALEQMGLLEQPHTSAGRVPSYQGYRSYIEKLMRPDRLTHQEKQMIDDMLRSDGASAQAVVENAVTALAQLTGYAAVNTLDTPSFSVIMRVEVIPAGHRLYALLLITSSGDVKNKVCRMEFDLTSEQLEFFENLINRELSGRKIRQLSPAMLQNLAVALGGYMMSLSPLLYALYELSNELSRHSVAMKGETNLLSYSDFDKGELLRLVSAKDNLEALLTRALDGVSVVFGQESDNLLVSNSSLVMSKYRVGDASGSFGVIGPVRLDYAKVIPYVEYFSDKVASMLSGMTQTQNGEPGEEPAAPPTQTLDGRADRQRKGETNHGEKG